MSIHKSLKPGGRLKRQRSVLTRTERLDKLKDEERWKDGSSVFGLPKVKVFKVKKKKAVKKEVEAEGAVEGAEAAVEGAAPAEGEQPPQAKPSAGKS